MPQRGGVVPPRPTAPFATPQVSGANTVSGLVMGLGTYAAVALAILMAVNVAISIWGIGLVWPHMDMHIYLFVITPFIYNFAKLGDWAFMGYYIFLVAAIVASFAWMIYKSIRPLTDELQVKYPKEGHSPLYTMGTVLFAILAMNAAYYFVIEAFGAVTNTPSFSTKELWQLIYSYAQAAVWEELVSRVLLIGIPLFLIDSALRRRDPGLGSKKFHRYILGGGFTIGRKEAALMVFSSIMFGSAHVFAWDLYKVLPAAVAGLAFAYLYLKLGLYASIMMHFATDFMTIPLNVWPDSLGVTTILGLLVLAWLIVGVPYVVLYFAKGLGWVLGRRVWPDLPPVEPVPAGAYSSPPYPAPVIAYPPMHTAPQYAPPANYPVPPAPRSERSDVYICQNCGNREAVYTDGKFVCTRCGAKR